MPIIRSSPLRAATVTLALLAAALLGASSAAARSTSAQLAARQVLVSFKHGTQAARVDALLARAGLRRVRTLSDIGTIVTRADGPRAAARATASLRASGATRYVERDGMAHIDSVPNDPYYSLGGSSGTSPYTLTKLEQGWDYATPSSAPIVAVVDSGVNAAEPDLAGAVMTGYNVFDGTTNTADVLGHGTAVAVDRRRASQQRVSAVSASATAASPPGARRRRQQRSHLQQRRRSASTGRPTTAPA